MKTKIIQVITLAILISEFVSPARVYGQKQKNVLKKYLQELPSGSPANDGNLQRYRMMAIYINRDLYGNFTGKQKISGEYTCGYKDGSATWNNIFISGSNSFSDPFPEGKRQEYMENFKYVPSMKMLEKDAFKNFPAGTETVFVKNLVWDMGMIEEFAWEYSGSLKINKDYLLSDHEGEFAMADVGTYEHASIHLTWTGISIMNNELCGVLEYRAVDNKIGMDMDQISTKGTEQYWGNTWVSLKTRRIEFAELYGGTIQEIEIKGMPNKFLVKTIRELWVERIK
jgi:hypothetical protein